MANAEYVMLYYPVSYTHLRAHETLRYPSAFSVNPGDALKVDQEVQRKVALVNSLNDLPENLTKEQVVQLLQEFNFVPAESEKSTETEGQAKARGRRAKVEEVVNNGD